MRRRVTTVFQRPTLLRRTVCQNVAYGLQLRGQRKADEQIQATLERGGPGHAGQQPARTLSGGEAQRVALARAMILEPDALLLDEPTANLDPYNVGLIESIVTELNTTSGTTLVLVTHNVFQARTAGPSRGLFARRARSSRSTMQKHFSNRRPIRAPRLCERGDDLLSHKFNHIRTQTSEGGNSDA